MKYSILIISLFLTSTLHSQNILRNANLIKVTGVTFTQVCNALLDSGYAIDKKDNELQTIRTETNVYKKYWNATYIINVRVKDSVAYFSGTFSAIGLFKDEPIFNQCKANGKQFPKSMATYPFNLINQIATGFGKPVEYSIR